MGAWIPKGTNWEENSESGRQTAEGRAYFNINHLSNILTGFKNPILSILPLSVGDDYLPGAAGPRCTARASTHARAHTQSPQNTD